MPAKQISLGPAQRRKVFCAQVAFAGHQEIVELRGLQHGSRQHGMDLAPVVHLVVEQVGPEVQGSGVPVG